MLKRLFHTTLILLKYSRDGALFMNKVMLFVGGLLSLCCNAAEVSFDVGGIQADEGVIVLLLFSQSEQDAFPSELNRASCNEKARASLSTVTLTCSAIEPAIYAAVVFHDVNDNGRLDHNWFGLPQEAFGFYRHYKVLFSPPDFEDVSFSLEVAPQHHAITVQHLFAK